MCEPAATPGKSPKDLWGLLSEGQTWLITTLTLPNHDPSAEAEKALMIGLLRSLSVFRGVTLAWAIGGVLLSGEHLDRPYLAAGLLGLMAVVTLLVTIWPDRGSLIDPISAKTVALELLVGAIVLVGDGIVYLDSRPQSLPWSWPAAGVMAAGIVYGTRAGILAAAFTGVASLLSEVVLLERDTGYVGAISKLGLWLLAGGIAGYVANRLRRAEAQISVVRAREEVSRQLHDGVLQTLAVIQRRADDAELSTLARDQEHELRAYLSGSIDTPTELEPELRRLAARHESLFGGRVQVTVAPDLPIVVRGKIEAMVGAVGEALTNAGKHGEAERVTIYAEPADGDDTMVFVSVKDDGGGFDPDETDERIGLSRSIRGRIEEAGGRVELTSRPGRGTEVQLWL